MSFLDQILGKIKKYALADIRIDESMRSHTTFRCEAMARALIYPFSVSALGQILVIFKEHSFEYKKDWDVIGRGSNLLIRDGGFQGILMDLSQACNQIELVKENAEHVYVNVGAGVANGKLLQYLRDKECSGFGFSFGIPGNIGGGIRMNAGTPLGWFSHVLCSVSGFQINGEFFSEAVSESDFVYRDFPKGHSLIFTQAEMRFLKSTKEQVEQEIAAAKSKRVNQPLELPNVGSIFKNPEGTFAAKLIEELELKGMRIGDAQISSKHSNFIVNLGHAKTSDVLALIELAQSKVKAAFNIQLEPEVKMIGTDV